MANEWMNDARKIPDETMSYLRKLAVRAIEEKSYSPEVIADVLGISRSSVYDWLKRYRESGWEALDSRPSPGAPALITAPIEAWLRWTVLECTPQDFGYDTALWTRDILAELLNKHFGLSVGGSTVGLHLRRLGLSYRKPWFRAREQQPHAVARFLNDTFPRIQRLAGKLNAEIAFEDEAGIGLQTQAGKTWGAVGTPPQVPVSSQRGGFNLLSAVTASGTLRFSIAEGKIDSPRYIAFLQQLIHNRTTPLIVIVDRAPFHRSKAVREFVRAHRQQIRVFFLPSYSPELNPDEQVWNTIKDKQVGRQAVKTKTGLKRAALSALRSLQQKGALIRSFFMLPDTQYAQA
ncbi:IS630 family transposase [Thiococcus pfennigii]|uniref:IS630 family transposase n=1 Tax=Thiococcus pfennigii TaxID=1057 RepID=UPI0019087BDB|nr:IS630 family transposase [Thiococcus pfennigii]